MVLDHSQVWYRLTKTAIHESMYPNWVHKNTRPAYTPGTNKTNSFHSYQGVQVPVQTWTPSPQYLRPSLNMGFIQLLKT
jgi:hypothetical protein